METSENLSKTFLINENIILFFEDMHEVHIYSELGTREEIHYDTIEEAKAYSKYLNSLNIKGLQTITFGYPYRIRLI